MTKDETIDFIKKLKAYQASNERARKSKSKNKKSLNILEPKAFDTIIRELKPTKLLELNRVSNSCSQICSKAKIKYEGLHPLEFCDKWDGDIICGYTDIKISGAIINQALSILQEGRFFAYCNKIDFLFSLTRYNYIHTVNPFNRAYIIPLLPLISKNGDFSRGESVDQYQRLAWFVWIGGVEQEAPTIHWLDDLKEYYITEPDGRRAIIPFADDLGSYCMYKRPIQVRVDKEFRVR